MPDHKFFCNRKVADNGGASLIGHGVAYSLVPSAFPILRLSPIIPALLLVHPTAIPHHTAD
jgi:hypothetical protein